MLLSGTLQRMDVGYCLIVTQSTCLLIFWEEFVQGQQYLGASSPPSKVPLSKAQTSNDPTPPHSFIYLDIWTGPVGACVCIWRILEIAFFLMASLEKAFPKHLCYTVRTINKLLHTIHI